MEEQDFWARLEFRLCAEFPGFDDRRLRSLSCDGLIPWVHDLDADEPSIWGRAWCGTGGTEEWMFTLLVDKNIGPRERIDWSALMPDDDQTGWLTPDPRRKTLTIDRRSAPSS